MLNNKSLKLGAVLLILGILIPSFSISLAQTSTAPIEKDKDFIACAVNADLKFKDFMSSVISYDGVLEYWEDILFRNRCQQHDVDNIDNQLSKIRAQIRSSFYKCDDARAKALGKTYDDKLTELYYVRHVVTSDPFGDAESSFAKFDNSLDGKLYRQMKEKFVDDKGYYTSSDFDTIYQRLQTNYQTRKQDYLSCSDPVFDDLVEKWDEFVETAGGFKKGGEAAKKKIDRGVKRLESTPPKATGNLLWGFLDTRVNGIDAVEGLEQIYESSKKDIPFADLPPSQGVIFERYTGELSRYQEDLTQAEFLARYDLMYKNTTDSIREAFEKKLKSTNQTIKDTFPTLNDLNNCVAAISLRQCKSSQ